MIIIKECIIDNIWSLKDKNKRLNSIEDSNLQMIYLHIFCSFNLYSAKQKEGMKKRPILQELSLFL